MSLGELTDCYPSLSNAIFYHTLSNWGKPERAPHKWFSNARNISKLAKCNLSLMLESAASIRTLQSQHMTLQSSGTS